MALPCTDEGSSERSGVRATTPSRRAPARLVRRPSRRVLAPFAWISLFAGCAPSGGGALAPLELPSPPSLDAVGSRDAAQPRSPVWALGGYALGQAEGELLRLAGEPTDTRLADDEASLWRSAGYDPDHEGPFLVGFDHVLEFDQASTARGEGRAPLFKAFIRRGRVVALTFTAFGVAPASIQGVGLPPCTFLAPEASIEARFGPPEAVEESGKGFEHLYPSKGLSIITEERIVQVMHFHEPLGARDARRVRERSTTAPADAADDASPP